MTSEENRGDEPWIDARMVATGLSSGLIAGVGMGIVLSIGTELMPLIGALYGQESFVGGWIAHLFNSSLFGLFFAAVIAHPAVRPNPSSLDSYVAYGLVYGGLLEIVTGGVLFPLWLHASGTPEIALPFFPIPGTVEEFLPAVVLGIAHLVYGGVLGLVYGVASQGDERAPPVG